MMSLEMTAQAQAQLVATRSSLATVSACIVELEAMLALNGQPQPSTQQGVLSASAAAALNSNTQLKQHAAMVNKLQGLQQGSGNYGLPSMSAPPPPPPTFHAQPSTIGKPIGIPLIKNAPMAPPSAASMGLKRAAPTPQEDTMKMLQVLHSVARQGKDGPVGLSANDHLARALANIGAAGSLARIRQQSANDTNNAQMIKRQRVIS
jgi:hypothetical protein